MMTGPTTTAPPMEVSGEEPVDIGAPEPVSRCPVQKARGCCASYGKYILLAVLAIMGAMCFVPVDMCPCKGCCCCCPCGTLCSKSAAKGCENGACKCNCGCCSCEQKPSEAMRKEAARRKAIAKAQYKAQLEEYKRQKAAIAREVRKAAALVQLQTQIKKEQAKKAAARQQIIDVQPDNRIAVMVKDQKTGKVRVVRLTEEEFRQVPIAYQEIKDNDGKVHRVPITVGQYDDTRKCMAYWGATAVTAAGAGIAGAVMNTHLDAASAHQGISDMHMADHMHAAGYTQCILFMLIGLTLFFFLMATVYCCRCCKGTEASVNAAH